ncbi:SAM domain and HD [Phlyctochytrium bullatum]|nr:SAM domain and HD [Phlyctochytrium bullatum]
MATYDFAHPNRKERGFFPRSVNDSVHGLLTFDRLCWDIIDTPQFQRLRDIKQLGSGYYVFPGASHNRFEHSLGVSYLADQFISGIKSRQPWLEIEERDVRCIKLAGLCHDLGHGPFSHIFDNEFIPRARHGMKWTHEIASEQLLEYLIDSNGVDIPQDEIRYIQDLIRGEPRNGWKDHGDGRRFLYEVVANKKTSVDVDKVLKTKKPTNLLKFDYIARDCLYLGVKNSYDYSRAMKFAVVVDNEVCFHQKEASNIYQLFHTRATLFKTVYTHRVGKSIELMLVDALLAADPYLEISSSIDDMSKYTYLTDSILKEIERSRVPELETARNILTRLRKRNLYSCVDFFILPKHLQAYGTKEYFNAEKVLSFQEVNSNSIIREEDIYVEILPISYCMKENNPVDFMRFTTKWNIQKSFPLPKEQVSLFTPESFQEITIRLYAKKDEHRRQLWEMFQRFIRSFGEEIGVPIELTDEDHLMIPTSTVKRNPAIQIGDVEKRAHGGERVSSPLDRKSQRTISFETSDNPKTRFDVDSEEDEDDEFASLDQHRPLDYTMTTPLRSSQAVLSGSATPKNRNPKSLDGTLERSVANTPAETPSKMFKTRSYEVPEAYDSELAKKTPVVSTQNTPAKPLKLPTTVEEEDEDALSLQVNLETIQVVDLKAELFRTQESFEKEKLKAGATSIRATSTKVFKKPDYNPGVQQRAAKDEQESTTEHNSLQASWVALQRKAAEYDKLKKKAEAGEDLGEDGDSDHDAKDPDKTLLVDFVEKTAQVQKSKPTSKRKPFDSDDDDDDDGKEDEDPWVETVDQFGRTKIVRKSQADAMRMASGFVKSSGNQAEKGDADDDGPTMVSADMRMQQDRENWEAEAREDITPLHYDVSKEIRTMGVGYYAFAKDETERQKQMEELKRIRDETINNRSKITIARDARKERLEERRALLRERKKKKIAQPEAITADTTEESSSPDLKSADVDEFLKSVLGS